MSEEKTDKREHGFRQAEMGGSQGRGPGHRLACGRAGLGLRSSEHRSRRRVLLISTVSKRVHIWQLCVECINKAVGWLKEKSNIQQLQESSPQGPGSESIHCVSGR